MRTARFRLWFLGLVVPGFLMVAPARSHAQFVAVNGQGPGSAASTNTTTWNALGKPPGSAGPLKDVYSGLVLGARVTVTANGTVVPSAGGGGPNPDTPLYDTFSGYISFQGADVPDALARIAGNSTVTYTFTGLNLQKLYNLSLGAVGGGTESTSPQQWTQFEIDGAVSFASAHTSGCYTNGLATNQVAMNTGVNTNGDLASWEDIFPDTNGSFSVTCSQYTGLIPSGATADGPYGYALSVLLLEEVNPAAPRVLSVIGTGDTVDLSFTLPIQPAGATNPANYSLTNLYGQVPILSAGFGTNDQSIRLITGHQLPFMKHWVNIAGLFDAATGTNAIAAHSTGVYTNLGFTTGYLKTEYYRGIAGTNLDSLTGSPLFPDHPSRVNYYPDTFVYDSTIGLNYGSRMSGILMAPVSGDYYFLIYSAGSAVLSISTNENPSAATPIATCSSQNYNPSRAVKLVAGQRYYLQALTKEGSTAADFLEILWSMPPDSGNWNLIPGAYLGNYLTEPGATINIVQQPASESVYEDRNGVFSVLAKSNSRILTEPNYQWQLNGVDIPDATSATYTTPLVYQTNSGRVYRVLTVVPGAAQFSSNAILTVTKDLVPPTVLRVLNFGTGQVELLFSEPLDPVSALTKTNYRFANGLPVLGVDLDTSQTSVTLTTPPLVYGSNYTIVINGIQDQAMVPNTIPADSLVSLVPIRSLSQDVGNPSLSSVTTNAGDGLNLIAGGREIGGTNDQFTFNSQLYAGDFDLRLRVAGLSASDIWASAGLMARESLEPGSRFAASLVTPSINGATFEYREGTNALATRFGGFPANYPDTWLRLQRAGDSFGSYASYDGRNWSVLGGAVFTNLPALLYVGLAVASHNSNVVTVAQFRDLGIVGPEATIGTIENPREALGPSSRKTPIVFSEIMYKPAPRTDGSNLEYLEIYNSAPWFHDISGYRIVADAMSYSFPTGTTIPGGGFLVIAASPQSIEAIYGIKNVTGPYTFQLPTNIWGE